MRQTFDLPFTPFGKERPRVALYGGRARAYTPAKTRTAEAALRYMLTEKGAVMVPRPAAVTLTLTFRLQRPASLPKRVVHATKKPDLDNTCKLLTDAANGVLYEDDAQIVELVARKVYAAQPGVTIEMDVLE